MSTPLDAGKSRPIEGGASFSLGNRIERLAWGIVWTLGSRWLPRPLFSGWRRVLLRTFGARIAPGCIIAPSVRVWLPRNLTMDHASSMGPGVDCYNMAPITIGARAIVSQRAFLCAGNHDPRDPDFQLVTAPITIGPGAWVAAEAFVGPGVTIGCGAVVAARACVSRDVAEWTIVAGNPAKQVGTREISGAGSAVPPPGPA